MRRKLLFLVAPGVLAIAGLGLATLPQHSSGGEALVPGLNVTKSEALAARYAITHGSPGDADSLQQNSSSMSSPDKGTKAGEPTIDSLVAQETAQRSFNGQAPTPAMVQNGVSQFNLTTDTAFPAGWTPLGPTWAPNGNNPDPNTGNQTAVSGRVSAFAVDPSTCNNATTCQTMYVGPANGGLWKTTDGGTTWSPMTDHLLNESIGYIAVDPVHSNIIYVGTGEPNAAGDTNRGIGLVRSTDGGVTWTQLDRNDFVNRAISTIIIDPRTAGGTNATLYVTSHRAINGSDYSQSAGCSRCTPGLPPIGFYKSTNGGATFTLNNPTGVNPNAGSQSLAMDAVNPDVLYLGISGDAANAGRGFYDGAGLYKSTDGGATWAALTANRFSGYSTGFQPSYNTSTHTIQPAPRLDRVTIAVGTDNPSVVYVALGVRSRVVNTPNGPANTVRHEEIYRSTDYGQTFSWLSNTPNACSSQCSYDMPLAVDPSNSDIVYAGGVANYDYVFPGGNPACSTFSPFPTVCTTTIMKSSDAGQTWSDIAENASTGAGVLHPDDHVIVIDPASPNVVWTGDDGGLFHTADGGTTWNDVNKGLDTLQAESLSAGPTGNLFFGTQDNGTYRLTPDSTVALHVGYGDGGVATADPTDANVAYITQYGSFIERDDAANAPAATHPNPFQTAGGGTNVAPAWVDYYYLGRGLFYEPNAVSPVNDNMTFQGTNTIYRSTNKGGVDTNNDWDATNPEDISTWTPVSPRLSGGAAVSAIAPSPTNKDVLAYATSNGRVYITNNITHAVTTTHLNGRSCNVTTDPVGSLDACNFTGGITWNQVSAGLPGRWITSLAWDPRGTGTLFATVSSFGAFTPSNPGHVYKLAPNGTTWTSLDGSVANNKLPDLPTNAIAINPHTGFMYVAQDFGLFGSTNGGRTWERWDYGLPNVPIYALAWDGAANRLAVATHGRGIWSASLP